MRPIKAWISGGAETKGDIIVSTYLADILNFIEFIKSSETASQATNNEDTKSKSEAYATTHPAMPEYIIVHNHLN